MLLALPGASLLRENSQPTDFRFLHAAAGKVNDPIRSFRGSNGQKTSLMAGLPNVVHQNKALHVSLVRIHDTMRAHRYRRRYRPSTTMIRLEW